MKHVRGGVAPWYASKMYVVSSIFMTELIVLIKIYKKSLSVFHKKILIATANTILFYLSYLIKNPPLFVADVSSLSPDHTTTACF